MFMQRQLKAEYIPLTKAAMTAQQDDAADTLARTLWGEARGENLAGLEAVANVIVNRVKVAQQRGGFWWGNDIATVCRKPYQFSCWNKTDLNYLKLLHVTADDRVFAMCQRIARRALNNVLADTTGGATHYHADSITASWAKGATPTAHIGRHLFYRILD